MLFSLRSIVGFSCWIAASPLGIGGGVSWPVPSAAPVVTPGSRFGLPPDDCAVPALLVPGGGALVCANTTVGAVATATIKIRLDILVIGASPSLIQPAARLLGSPTLSEETHAQIN